MLLIRPKWMKAVGKMNHERKREGWKKRATDTNYHMVQK